MFVTQQFKEAPSTNSSITPGVTKKGGISRPVFGNKKGSVNTTLGDESHAPLSVGPTVGNKTSNAVSPSSSIPSLKTKPAL